jgi:hypothetical protein
VTSSGDALASARGRTPERAGSVTGGRKEKKVEKEEKAGEGGKPAMSGFETKEVETAMGKSVLSIKNAKLQGMLSSYCLFVGWFSSSFSPYYYFFFFF